MDRRPGAPDLIVMMRIHTACAERGALVARLAPVNGHLGVQAKYAYRMPSVIEGRKEGSHPTKG